MTKTLEVNCDTLWLAIKIGLWVGASIGISCLTYRGYDVLINGYDFQTSICDIEPKSDFCHTVHHSPIPDLFIISMILDIVDVAFLWAVINNKYKLVELKCKSRGSFT